MRRVLPFIVCTALSFGLASSVAKADTGGAKALSNVDYVQHYYESRANVWGALCDSTASWRHRKFPIYCWILYRSGRWSDYRVRIGHTGLPYRRWISSGVWCDRECPVEAF